MTPTDEITPAIPAVGTTVGFYHLKEAHVKHDASFETASWWEDTQLDPGIYPIKVGVQTYGRSKPLFLYAEGQGKVIDAFFPASLGGLISGGSNKERHVGKINRVCIPIGIKEAVSRTGNSPSDKGPDVWVDPAFWEGFAAYAEERLAESLKHFNGPTYDRHRLDEVRTMKIRAGWIAEDAELVETILDRIRYWGERTPMKDATLLKNTDWATNQTRQ